MVIDDVRPQDLSNHAQEISPNDTTPPAQSLDQDNQEEDDELNDQGQEESNDHGEDEDDGDKGEAPPHPRVRQNIQRDHPIDNILGDIKNGVTTRSYVANFCEHYSFISSFEPFKIKDALCDWVVAMKEELNYFKLNEVWSLVKRQKQNVVGTKCVFCNKQDEYGVATRNKT
jgi:cobalamin biosynthesis protein CobT